MDEQQTRAIIRDELSFLIKNNKLVFGKPMQIMDGNDITLGQAIGTRIGTSITQKLGFFGATPVTKQATLRNVSIDPTSDPVGYDAYARAGVQDINSTLTTLGLANY